MPRPSDRSLTHAMISKSSSALKDGKTNDHTLHPLHNRSKSISQFRAICSRTARTNPLLRRRSDRLLPAHETRRPHEHSSSLDQFRESRRIREIQRSTRSGFIVGHERSCHRKNRLHPLRRPLVPAPHFVRVKENGGGRVGLIGVRSRNRLDGNLHEPPLKRFPQDRKHFSPGLSLRRLLNRRTDPSSQSDTRSRNRRCL